MNPREYDSRRVCCESIRIDGTMAKIGMRKIAGEWRAIAHRDRSIDATEWRKECVVTTLSIYR
jgi:hypothetical protein